MRRYRRSDVLMGTALVSAHLERAEYGKERTHFPSFVRQFTLAGLARAALAHSNDHRSKAFGERELVDLCDVYYRVVDPDDDAEPGRNHLRQMLGRLAYEQFGQQLNPRENVGRSLALFEDRAHLDPRMPSSTDWVSAFGATVSDLVHIGFAAYTGSLVHEGRVPIEAMSDSRFDEVYGSLKAPAAVEALENFFCGDVGAVGVMAREWTIPGREKWSANPLSERPIVRLGTGEFVAPSPRLILERFSPAGLFYAGGEVFGDGFRSGLGAVFEAYVGDQLRLLGTSDLLPEIVYQRNGAEAKTCDWFVVTDECVVLVEVKATRPVVAVRSGQSAGLSDLKRKLGRAVQQINTTFELMESRHPSVRAIPADRPVVGLVVTLDPFFAVGPWLYEDLFAGSRVPTSTTFSHELERVVGGLAGRGDVGERLRDALTGGNDVSTSPRLPRALEGLALGDEPTDTANPIIMQAWQRILPERARRGAPALP